LRQQPAIELTNTPLALCIVGTIGVQGDVNSIKQLGEQLDTEAGEAAEKAARLPADSSTKVSEAAARLKTAQADLAAAQDRADDCDVAARDAIRKGDNIESAETAAATAQQEVVKHRRRVDVLKAALDEARRAADAAYQAARKARAVKLREEGERLMAAARESMGAAFMDHVPAFLRGVKLVELAKSL
jgi:hypothetical protein